MAVLELLWRGVAIIHASAAGRRPAEKLAEELGKAGVVAHIFQFSQLDAIWGCYDAYVFIMALGGVVRWICNKITHKETDPPVLVVTHDLKYIIPILGSHRGANELAGELAALIRANAVVTTVAEKMGLTPVEVVTRLLLCKLEQSAVLEVYKALIEGKRVCVEGLPPGVVGYADSPPCDIVIKRGYCEDRFCCRPLRLFVGFGSKTGVSPQEIAEAVRALLNVIRAERVEAVASIRPEVYQVAELLGARPLLFKPDELSDEKCLSPPNQIALKRLGIGNVAEAAALKAAGPGGELLVRKRAFGGKITVAIAAASPYSAL
ncbi:cobalt-precorrin 5A hydrolase [Pyrobaculum aerophilum]|uniref:Cobalamin biosynthesis protein CbiG n=1 Tax=Pyrobaculum aerophilum TaxID=13773 RepID=A0A371QWN8_9CREN|nr:cobalt-precorrin 5A hydrolase [Pyrobaculum aerophilum]RFA94850.1 cobalamin biosynthesis protein CbiG [Pyrobaculum aerophilum]RFA99141.1 cobalamin biosynthesis protein CbiG [Pyrobaculum aerophilum]